MSEEYYDPETGEAVGTLWHGIPLASVRAAFFIDKLRTVHTLRKLFVNGVEYALNSAEDGAVVVDGSYLNWQFICPVGAFTAENFAGKTVGEFYDTIIDYTQQHSVKALEDFAGYIAPQANTVNQVFTQVTGAAVTAPALTGSIGIDAVPTFSAPANFSALISWIKGTLPPQLLQQQASVMQMATEGGQTNFGVTLLLTTEVEGFESVAMTFSFTL